MDFTSRLQPVLDHLPFVLFNTVCEYVGKELIPRFRLDLKPNVLGVVELNDRLEVYWMHDLDLMCNDTCIAPHLRYGLKSMQYIDGKLFLFNDFLFDSETRLWKPSVNAIPQQYLNEIHYFNGMLYTPTDDHICTVHLNGQLHKPVHEIGKGTLTIIGDCLSVRNDAGAQLVGDARFYKDAIYVYKYHNDTVEVYLYQLFLNGQFFVVDSKIIQLFGWEDTLLIQCHNGDVYVFSINKKELLLLSDPITYHITKSTLWSISHESIFIY